MDLATITHKLMLSTTEDNLVGEVKVRQADDETQLFEVTVLENGTIKNFAGLKPFFCLMAREITGQGVSEEPVTAYDDTKGTLKYTLSANAMQMVGRNEAYFSFRKELTNGAWAEQFSTRSFFYTVEKSIYTQPFKDSNYWFTFKELYRLFNDYIDSGKLTWEDFMDSESDSWKNFIEQNREIIESIDPGGVVLTELIDARKPEDKASFNNLARRLDFTDQTTLVANSAAQYNTDPRTKFIAHRGHEAVCPENTMKAFELAFLAGYDGIETDAQCSADGIWYCFHDDTVDRMTNGTGVFTDLTSAQINQLIIDGGNGVSVYPGERIPTLESCLSYCKKVGLYPQIELKKLTNDSDFESFCNLMKKYGFNNNQGTILCNYTVAPVLRNYWPEAFLTVFYTNTPEFDKHVFSNTPYTAVGIEHSLLLSDISVLDKYKSKGVRVGTYTIRQSLYESVKKLGLDFIGGNVVE